MNEQQKKSLRLVIKKTGVSEEIALWHLSENQYKVNPSIRSIENEIYTKTQLILRNYKNKEMALSEICHLVEKEHYISRIQQTNFKNLRELASEIQTLIIIMEWLNYEENEDFEKALSFQLEDFSKQIKETFHLTRLAETLQKTKVTISQIYEKYKKKGNLPNYASNIHEEIWKNSDFQECERLFRSQKALIIDKLFNFIETNISQFP